MTPVIACGLRREARIVARPGWPVAVGGGDGERLERELDALAARSSGPILSCGIAGALAAQLQPGAIVIDGDAEVVEWLRRALPDAVCGGIIGSDSIVATAAAKRALAAQSGGLAVDMESHIAARVARRQGKAFAAIRAISDRLTDDLPPAALIGMKPDGGMALGAVLASLARRPGQLPALLRTGRQAGQAFRALAGASRALANAPLFQGQS